VRAAAFSSGPLFQSMNATCRMATDSVSVFISTWCHPSRTIVL